MENLKKKNELIVKKRISQFENRIKLSNNYRKKIIKFIQLSNENL